MLSLLKRALLALFVFAATSPLQAQWSTPVNLFTGPSSILNESIAIDSNGNATAVWGIQREINSTLHVVIQSATKEFGGSWGPAEDIYISPENALSSVDGFISSIVVDPFGNATVLCYKDFGAGKKGFQTLTKPFGGSWQGPVVLSIADDVFMGNNGSQMDVDSQGNIAVIWTRQGSSDWQIRSAIKPFGSDWLPTQTLLTSTTQLTFPNIKFDIFGNAIAVWQNRSLPQWPVYAAVKSFDSNTWQTPVQICNNGTELIGTPKITSDSSGNVFVVWTADVETPEIQSFILSVMKPAGSSTWQPVEVAASITDDFQGYSSIKIASDSKGNLTTVCEFWNGSYNEIMWSYRPFGGSWQAPALLSSPGLNSKVPQLTVDDLGNATAVWAQFNGTDWVIQSADKLADSTTWQTPVVIGILDIAVDNTSTRIQLTQDPNGNITTLWFANGVDANELYASTFYAPPKISGFSPSSGPKVGGNEVVIQGMNFIDVSSVLFGTVPASFTVNSPTSITAIAPPGSGIIDVVITSPLGSSTSSSATKYMYLLAPPTHLRGKFVLHAFSSQVEYMHRLSWKASPDADVTKYLVYRDGSLFKTVLADKPLVVKARNLKSKKRVEYRVVAYDDSGIHSEPVTITIK